MAQTLAEISLGLISIDLQLIARSVGISAADAQLADVYYAVKSPDQKSHIDKVIGQSQPLYKFGSIRGVRNGVRTKKTAIEKHHKFEPDDTYCDSDLVVVYVTSLGVNGRVHDQCRVLVRLLDVLRIHYQIRDLYVNTSYKCELSERMQCSVSEVTNLLPQVFLDGSYFADFQRIQLLNEMGVLCDALRHHIRPFSSTQSCHLCAGMQCVVCPHCNGSKRSRNHLGLRCTLCDEGGVFPCVLCQPNCHRKQVNRNVHIEFV